jgi:hypothetical protein
MRCGNINITFDVNNKFQNLKKQKVCSKCTPNICHAAKHLIYAHEKNQLLFLVAIARTLFKKEISNKITNVVLSLITLLVLFFLCNNLFWKTLFQIQIPKP